MRVYNPQTDTELGPELAASLKQLRAERGFDAQRYVQDKTALLNAYLREHGLRACVVAVSGGVDSAVVLALVAAAARAEGSPIERIVPVALPVYSEQGATNQDDALDRGQLCAAACGLEAVVIDLTATQAALKGAVDAGLGVRGEGWADGQLVAYARTPALYYVTSLLTQQGLGAVICGTTNRDEGAYLGYIGKASDGMVDVQLIADLHKSEVYAVGRQLGVPEPVLAVTPSGDMYDGRPDEEVFGAPYDFVELYLLYLALDERAQAQLRAGWGPQAREQFAALGARLEKLHAYNGHKYLGKSPAVHLNSLPSAVPGGWDHPVLTPSSIPTIPDRKEQILS